MSKKQRKHRCITLHYTTNAQSGRFRETRVRIHKQSNGIALPYKRCGECHGNREREPFHTNTSNRQHAGFKYGDNSSQNAATSLQQLAPVLNLWQMISERPNFGN